MPEPVVHIARDEVELGAFPFSEARELMDAGFFHPDDDAWTSGMTEWGRLDTTIRRLAESSSDWRDKVIVGAEALSRVVGRRLGEMVGKVKAQAAGGHDAIGIARRLALEHYLPQIRKILGEYLRDKPASIAQTAVRDEATMRKVSGALYDCLPKPVCRFVSEEVFITFCLEHRRHLLGSGPASPDGSANLPSDDAPRA